MRPNIPQNLRITVLSLYLQGESRNQIALKTGISQGSVSNIVAAWKKGLDEGEAADLRDLGIMMKRANLNPLQCVSGFRTAQLLNKLGLDEDSFESYISNIHKRCGEIGIDSQNVALGIKQLLVLCETIPIWQLSEYLESKRTEKANLEESVAKLKEEEGQRRIDLQNVMDKDGITLRQIEDYRALKSRLQKAGVQLTELELFVKSLEGARELGYDAKEIVRILGNIKASAALNAELQRTISDKKFGLERLEEERSKQELVVGTNHVMIIKLKHLESMGFGLKELTILSDTVKEMAIANDIPVNSAVTKFVKDIEENYEPNLSLQEKCKNAQAKLDNIKGQHLSILAALTSKKQVADLISQIQSLGYQDHEIVELAYELRPELRPLKPPAANSASGISMDMIMNMNMNMNMWHNLFQNKTLQSNTAPRNEDTQKSQDSQSKPPIAGNLSYLHPLWNLRFPKLKLISSAGDRAVKTFEKEMKEVKEMCEYSNAVKRGNIQVESPLPIKIPSQD